MLAAPHPAGYAGATWRRFSDVRLRIDCRTPRSPPARSDHDLSWDSGPLDCTAPPASRVAGESGRVDPAGAFLLVGQSRHFSRSRRDLSCAPGCGGQGRPQAARAAGPPWRPQGRARYHCTVCWRGNWGNGLSI